MAEREQVAEALAAAMADDTRMVHAFAGRVPDHHTIRHLIDRFRGLLFPGLHGRRDIQQDTLQAHLDAELSQLAEDLCAQIHGALKYADESSDIARAHEITWALLEQLPRLRTALSEDVQAAYDGDPAARHTDEVILCYPGVRALIVHRLAHAMFKMDVPLLPRIMQEHAHSDTGIDIHPGASIGVPFFIDHGTGVVIGETTIIGDHCKLYQGVTLGARSFERAHDGSLVRGRKRHPTLGNHVTVYAGATILGGDTIVGDHCVVAGGVFLSRSVPEGHIVCGAKPEFRLIANPDQPQLD